MVPFAGWEMPVQFAGIIEEHIHTRTACSVFDVSHMGRLKISGADAATFLNWICTRNLTGAEPGRCYYSHICREDGGILDDVIVSRFQEDCGIVCNASNREKIISWLRKHSQGTKVEVIDQTMQTAMVACQGPKTIELARTVADADLFDLKRYHFRDRGLGPLQVSIYRTGYTGEDGIEIVAPAMLAAPLIPRLLGTPESPHPVIRPAGLGARDTLRMEAGMPLYGHELSEDVDSLSAGQAWCVDLEKDFLGAQAMRTIKQRGLKQQLVGLELEGRRIARQDYVVYGSGGEAGKITSGTLSPTLGKSIAMAFVRSDHSAPGTALEVEISGKRIAAKVVSLPFYKRPK